LAGNKLHHNIRNAESAQAQAKKISLEADKRESTKFVYDLLL
jgi:hypothetical protein